MTDFAKYFDSFAGVLGADNVWRGERECAPYNHDNKITGLTPIYVLRPGSVPEVQGVMRICNEHGLPVIARGAGTGNVGGAVCEGPAVMLDMMRMDRIIALDSVSMTVKVEAGLITQKLQTTVEEAGLFYPPDPASADACTIGGNAATNAGGLRAVKYGVTKDYVLGLRVVLADGRLLETGRATRKGVVGYDLTSLFVGSEGTLGVICELTLKLVRRPDCRKTMAASFMDIEHCAEGVEKILQSPVLPSGIEMVDEYCLAAVERSGKDLRGITAPFLLIELDGRKNVVEEEAALLDEILTKIGAKTRVAENEKQSREIWDARRVISDALKEMAPKKIAEDVAVPISALAKTLGEIEQLAKRLALQHAVYGHAGDGNLHVNVFFDPDEQGAPEKIEEFRGALFDLTLDNGGTISGEHGVGISKRPFIARELSAVSLDLHRSMKELFDPRGILNPGKIWPRK